MPIVKLDTGFNIEVEFAVTPFHKRLFAWLIDVLLIIIYYIVSVKLMGEAPQWAYILLSIPPLFYHLFFEAFLNGQSVGKMLLRIKVISADGGHPSFSQYLVRWAFRLADLPTWLFAFLYAGELPPWCGLLILSGIVSVLVTPLSQRIGDLLAGTIIIDTRVRTSWEDTVFTELEEDYKPRYPQVMNLTDKDINTLKGIIGTVKKRRDYDLSMRIAEKIQSRLHINSDQESLEFLETLLKDYNYYTTR